MSRTDVDITAIRDLPPGGVEPSDASVARTWHAVNRGTSGPAPSRSRRWVLTTAAAAGVVVATGSATVLLRRDPGIEPAALPSVPVWMPVEAAVAEMVAAAARTVATALPADRFLYVAATGVAASIRSDDTATLERVEHEQWMKPYGLITARIDVDGRRVGPDDDEETRALARLAVNGPSLLDPTAEFLADLARHQFRPGHGASWFVDLTELFHRADPLLTPETRTAIYRGLGRDPLHISAGAVDAGGRRLIVFRHTDLDTTHDILFDPLTGHAAGRRSGKLGAPLDYRAGGGVDPTLVEPGVLSQELWRWAVVDEPGRSK
jgi:hypothetical protein